MTNDLWLPPGGLDWKDRIRSYVAVVDAWAGERVGLNVLEVGVLHGDLTKQMHDDLNHKIGQYVGVDPFLGTPEDPYFKGYWKEDQNIAETAYNKTAAKYLQFGFKLLRQKSEEFFSDNKEVFDVIVIDGDHREAAAYADLKSAISCLRIGGLLICDDFGNPDHPGVTKAACRFDADFAASIAKRGTKYSFFTSASRSLAYPLGIAFWQKA